jgi:hypothetical protein
MTDEHLWQLTLAVVPGIVSIVSGVVAYFVKKSSKNTTTMKQKKQFGLIVGVVTFGIVAFVIGYWMKPGTAKPPTLVNGTPKTNDIKPPPPPQVREFPFSFSLGKLHIFSRSDGPKMANLPGDAEVCITTSKPPFMLTAKVDLEQGVQSIKKLVVAIQYEYHADTVTNRNSASLQFALKDSAGKEVWIKTQGFLPKVPMTVVDETNVFSFDCKYDLRDITVEVTPLRSGNFGFFIYQLNGTLTAQ